MRVIGAMTGSRRYRRKGAGALAALLLLFLATAAACSNSDARRNTSTPARQMPGVIKSLDLEGGSRIQLQADCVEIAPFLTQTPTPSDDPLDILVATAYPDLPRIDETACAGSTEPRVSPESGGGRIRSVICPVLPTAAAQTPAADVGPPLTLAALQTACALDGTPVPAR